jgi:hypothetical protein
VNAVVCITSNVSAVVLQAVLILMDRYCCSGEELTANSTPVKQSELEPLEQLDITKYLVFRKSDEEGPDVRGGHPDALIIHATRANKNGELRFVDSIAGVCPLHTKY